MTTRSSPSSSPFPSPSSSPSPWPSLALLTLLTLLTACAGKPVDPLAKDRARLLALEEEPLDEAFPAEATLVVGEEMLRQGLEAALEEAALEARALFEVPTGAGTLTLAPEATVERLTLVPSPSCDACATLNAFLTGVVEGRLGPFAQRLPWQLEVGVPLALLLERGDLADRVLARVVEGDLLTEATLEGLPPALAQQGSALLEERLRKVFERRLVPDIVVAELPRDPALRLRGVRARPASTGEGQSALAIDLAFVALERGAVGPLPAAGDGFVLVLPARTLLGIARAAALRAGPIEGFAPEPTSLVVEGDRFGLELAVWRIAPEPVADRFLVEGRLALEDGALKLEPTHVEEAKGARFTLDPVDLLVRARVLEELEKALTVALPASREEALAAERKLTLEVTKVEGRDGALHVRGQARLVGRAGPKDPS